MAAVVDSGKLAENIVHFARALRRAGMPVGPSAVIDAIRAVEVAGIAGRGDFYWTLHAIFVKRRDHHAVFDEAFRLFWRSRKGARPDARDATGIDAETRASARGGKPRRRGPVRGAQRYRRRASATRSRSTPASASRTARCCSGAISRR